MKKLFLGMGCSLLSLGFAAASAQAQTAPAEEAGEIIVTANRDPSKLSKTPIALTAVTGDTLRTSGVTTPTTLGELTPNLSINRDPVPASGGGLQITIRGITSTDATEKGDPSAAFLRDGIYIARPQAQEVSFFDVDRVEVLRGPQGTLYGRNTTAGVVNVLTVRPKNKFEVIGDFGYASFNAISATGVVNVPLSDNLAVRAAVNHERRDSIVNPPANNQFGINPYSNNTSARLSLLFTPSDKLSIYVQGDYSWIKGAGFGVVPIDNFFVRSSYVADTTPLRTNFSNDALRVSRVTPQQEFRDNRDRGIMGETTLDVGIGKLTWLASYREMDRNEQRHGAPTGQRKDYFIGNFWQHSEELRLSMGGDSWWKAQIGGYYFKEQSSLLTGSYPSASFSGVIQSPTKSLSKGLFGQVTLTPIDGFNLTGGVRYSHDDKSRVGVIARDTLGTPVTLATNNAAAEFSKTTWRLGADYDVPGLGLIYATVSTGYKAGGFNDGCIVGSGGIGCDKTTDQLYYKPETLTAYEAGFKWKLAGDEFRLNGSVFHYDFSNMQVSQASTCAGTSCQVTTSAGRSEVDGIELESVIRPASGHTINLSLNWLDARFTEFTPVAGVSLAGMPLSRAPKWTWTAGYTFSHELGDGGKITANVNTRFSDRYDLTDLATRVHFYQPSFTKTGASLGYTAPGAQWNIQVYAKNLENVLTLTFARNSATNEAAFEEPRSFGVRAGFKF